MICDVGEMMESLENELCSHKSSSVFFPMVGPTLQNSGTKAAILPKDMSSIANSGTQSIEITQSSCSGDLTASESWEEKKRNWKLH